MDGVPTGLAVGFLIKRAEWTSQERQATLSHIFKRSRPFEAMASACTECLQLF